MPTSSRPGSCLRIASPIRRTKPTTEPVCISRDLVRQTIAVRSAYRLWMMATRPEPLVGLLVEDPRVLAAALPDAPRWIYARSVLLSGSAMVRVNAGGDAALAMDSSTAVLVGRPDCELLRDVLTDHLPGRSLLVHDDAGTVACSALPGWVARPSTVHRGRSGPVGSPTVVSLRVSSRSTPPKRQRPGWSAGRSSTRPATPGTGWSATVFRPSDRTATSTGFPPNPKLPCWPAADRGSGRASCVRWAASDREPRCR